MRRPGSHRFRGASASPRSRAGGGLLRRGPGRWGRTDRGSGGVIGLDAASQHPLLSTAALIMLVYLTCLGGALAAQLAWRGHSAYWLTAFGALLLDRKSVV